MSPIKRYEHETFSFLAHVYKALVMITNDTKEFINSLDSKEQQEYKSDIVELKKRIWCRVMLEPKMPLKKK